MRAFNKVFGIGISKTGTTTLAECFEILGLTPHKSIDRRLKRLYRKGKGLEPLLRTAERYLTFENTPWYLAYRELDRAFPGSLFILTVRKDSLTYARSAWAHTVRAGVRSGEPTQRYLSKKSGAYEEHNLAVLEYFADRPDDLLVLCWERGDGWEELCRFLDSEVPEVPIPHANVGRYGSLNAFVRRLEDSPTARIARRLLYRLAQIAYWLLGLIGRRT